MSIFGPLAVFTQLKGWAFVTAFLLVGLFAAFNGLLMLISPERQMRLWDRLVKADRWSPQNPNWKPGRQLERRFAGFAVAVMALWMVSPPVRWLLHREPTALESATSSPLTKPWFHWSGLAAPVPIFVWGLYMFVRPGRVARLGTTQNPQRIFPHQTSKVGLWAVRFIGVAIMAVSAFAIYAMVARGG